MSKTVTRPPTMESRLAKLERGFDALRDQVLGLKAVRKDWKSTVGMLPDDEMTRSAFRRAAAWRKRQRAN
jgi:hypothetical protein